MNKIKEIKKLFQTLKYGEMLDMSSELCNLCVNCGDFELDGESEWARLLHYWSEPEYNDEEVVTENNYRYSRFDYFESEI